MSIVDASSISGELDRQRTSDQKKLALLYCVTGQPHLQARLEGSIAEQNRIDNETGIACPYTRILVTDVTKESFSAPVLDFFDEFVTDTDVFVEDPYIRKRYFSLSKMRNAGLKYAAGRSFDWVLLCDSDTIMADYHLDPSGLEFGVPEVYWQKDSDEHILESLKLVKNPDENTFAKGNSWFLIAKSIFEKILFNENIYGYGFEDNEYEARVLATGAKSKITLLRVIHKFHPVVERNIDDYSFTRNRAIFQFVLSELRNGRNIDVKRRLDAVPSKHPDWQGAFLLFPDTRRLIQWDQRQEATYQLQGEVLYVAWDKFSPEAFKLAGEIFVSIEDANTDGLAASAQNNNSSLAGNPVTAGTSDLKSKKKTII